LQRARIIYSLFLFIFLAHARRGDSQTNTAMAQSAPPYNLRVSVDEVVLTFHAVDVHGLPINDLRVDELRLLDNGRPPRKIITLQSLQDHPIHAGILMDTSKSMEGHLSGDRTISIEYVQRLLRQQTDQAFIMDFGYITKLTQPWTGDPVALTASIHRVVAGKANPLGGTALLDAIFRACFNEFGKVDHASGGNFILLFSDGEDNASHTSLKDAVDICQHSNTAIYAFRAEPNLGASTGPGTLAELTTQTGGRVFYDDDPEAKIYENLRTIEADLRSQYRLVYNPADLRHDNSFHRIELHASERVDNILIRSGYYDKAR
jgi:VWFA-related protein